MFARTGLFSGIGRSAAMATVVAIGLTTIGPVSAFAGETPAGKGLSASTAAHGITDVSSRRRVYRGGGGGAAAAAAFAGIVGTGIAIAASQNRENYYDSYGSYGAPSYGYYGDGPAYGGYRSYGPGRGSRYGG